MDPTVAFLEAVEGDTEALQGLAEWLVRGGFCPSSLQAEDLDPETFREAGLVDLAAAVRVAVAYGDLSGLKGLQ